MNGSPIRYVEPHIAARAPGLRVAPETVVKWARRGLVVHRRLPGGKKARYRIAIDAEGWPLFTEGAP